MGDNNVTEKSVYGCLAITLFFVLALVLSIAVGVFFGAGFGLLACSLFIAFSIACVLHAFKNAAN